MLLAFRKTCAIILQPGTADYGGERFVCLSADNDNISTNSPFGDSYVLSLGWAVTACLVIPFSLRNLGGWGTGRMWGGFSMHDGSCLWVAPLHRAPRRRAQTTILSCRSSAS